MMIFLLFVGGYSAFTMQRETLPEFSLDMIRITVIYKGASADEIEESIGVKIEEEVSGLEGVKKVISKAVEGSVTVVAELEAGANVTKVLDDIKNGVDQIDTFPEEAETPIIVEITRSRPVIKISVYGDMTEKALFAVAQEVENELLRIPGLTQVELFGNREHEIWVEIPESNLRKYGLTLSEVAQLIKRNTLDLPAGSIQAESGKVLLRTKGRRYRAREFEDLVIISRPDGTSIPLSRIASKIVDTFEDVDVEARMDGKKAIVARVQKTTSQDSVKIARSVRNYVERKNAELPDTVRLQYWDDDSVFIMSRLSLLVRNGLQGLLVVLVILALFLRFRVAFWVAMGIPISMMGAFFFLGVYGYTLNMISMFAFIVVLGIVVDDAIVIGENIYQKLEAGIAPMKAALEGAYEMAYPVMNAVATTIVAFAPMLFVAGVMGKLMMVFPLAIIAVLLVSLVEVYIILPCHLAHMRAEENDSIWWNPLVRIEKVRLRLNLGLNRFVENRFLPVMDWIMLRRYYFLSSVLALLIVCFGLVTGGRVTFVLFPKMDSDRLTASLVLPEGTNIKTTNKAIARIVEAAREMARQRPRKDGRSIIKHTFSLAGEQLTGSPIGQDKGGHVAEVVVMLISSEERGIPSNDLVSQWRELTGEIPEAVALTFSATVGAGPPGGQPIEIQLLGDDFDKLLVASQKLQSELATFEGVEDINDSYREGKREFRLSLRDGARQLGITLADLAGQVRAGFWGEEPLKVQRGRNEVTIRVRYPEEERVAPGDLENLKIRTADGKEIPFLHVAHIEQDQGPAVIQRIYGRRAITVTADVDETKANAREIINKLQEGFFDELTREYPGVSILLEGQQERTQESMSSLFKGFVVALFLIFILLSNMFRNYTQPLIIMAAIPFSFIGILLGHMLFQMDFTLLSMFGVLALSGIVVNDSLLLIEATNREVRNGMNIHDALLEGARNRFRQIILTTLSTIGGLTPIMMETSVQAQFLKPMVITVVFGLLASTVLILLFIPSLTVVREDIINLRKPGPG
jgi:multidrug efflux pump subunit AcrB